MRVWISSVPILREIETKIERPILASTAAKETTTINRVVSISAGFPKTEVIKPTVISVIASSLSSAIKKCFRWETSVKTADMIIAENMI